ncbi:hypothetical protein [endosymbiont GvMRE of Glomus versiforme]|uniref:hypothetical protein n=1 Tax=endosymbiont GvMRE of Glomus versiforme TaxID=2039283 RepID=UPI000EBA8159|nr:hypothetical protein [endosymbiont GvMRE of Glomus versiforme]RHZ36786.1 hypothetical protein GvMRE_I2g285 [endosymbiont GvMRE of Glomus versiforme]
MENSGRKQELLKQLAEKTEKKYQARKKFIIGVVIWFISLLADWLYHIVKFKRRQGLGEKDDEIFGCCFSRAIPFMANLVCFSLDCCFNYRSARIGKMAKLPQSDKKNWSRNC